MEKMSTISYSLAVLCVILVGSYGAHAIRLENKIIPAEYVAEHNAARAEVGVPPVTWDGRLAAIAQAWADRCVWEHGMPPNNYPTDYIGQNLAAGSWDEISAKEVVQMFVEEKAYYHYNDNSCDSDKQCGHYTQVVWRNTTRIGCAKSPPLCTEGLTMVVCNYAPGGNMVGLKPY